MCTLAKRSYKARFARGELGTNPVRVDIPNPTGLRMPSGNELGANAQWLPDGKTLRRQREQMSIDLPGQQRSAATKHHAVSAKASCWHDQQGSGRKREGAFAGHAADVQERDGRF